MGGELAAYPLGRRARWLVAAICVVLGVAAAVVVYRFHYGIWPGARYPATLHYCGRSYDRVGPEASRSAVAALASETARPAEYSGSEMYPAFEFTAPLTDSYRVFAGQPRRVHVGDTPTCTVHLYLRTDADRYLTYALDGSVG